MHLGASPIARGYRLVGLGRYGARKVQTDNVGVGSEDEGEHCEQHGYARAGRPQSEEAQVRHYVAAISSSTDYAVGRGRKRERHIRLKEGYQCSTSF